MNQTLICLLPQSLETHRLRLTSIGAPKSKENVRTSFHMDSLCSIKQYLLSGTCGDWLLAKDTKRSLHLSQGHTEMQHADEVPTLKVLCKFTFLKKAFSL